MIIDLPDDPSKFELSFDKYLGIYYFFYTVQQTLISDVYNTFWDAFGVNITDCIIWAYMDYHYVWSIFFKIRVIKWSDLVIVAPLKLFKYALPSVTELINKF